ncbi:hypothetical protein F2981_21845 (plasmid) [Sinorhizobium meliloti]|nr:hypothetical protein [Sinorhizobium meliloti]
MVDEIEDINDGLRLANEENEKNGRPQRQCPELRTPSLRRSASASTSLPPAFVAFARLGKAAAEREYAAARDGLKVFRPLQRGEDGRMACRPPGSFS